MDQSFFVTSCLSHFLKSVFPTFTFMHKTREPFPFLISDFKTINMLVLIFFYTTSSVSNDVYSYGSNSLFFELPSHADKNVIEINFLVII